jgi:hypothetical protein
MIQSIKEFLTMLLIIGFFSALVWAAWTILPVLQEQDCRANSLQARNPEAFYQHCAWVPKP